MNSIFYVYRDNQSTQAHPLSCDLTLRPDHVHYFCRHDSSFGVGVKRLLTTTPGSATPTLAAVYNPETAQSETVLITHIVPTSEVPSVSDYLGWSRENGPLENERSSNSSA